jgi:hypothetical protein
MSPKDLLDVAAALITVGGFLFGGFKLLQARAAGVPKPSASQPFLQVRRTRRSRPTTGSVVWGWGPRAGAVGVASSALAWIANALYVAAYQMWLVGLVTVLVLLVLVASCATVLSTGELRHGIGAGGVAGFLGVNAFLAFIANNSLVIPPGASASDIAGGYMFAMLFFMLAVLVVIWLGGSIAQLYQHLFT